MTCPVVDARTSRISRRCGVQRSPRERRSSRTLHQAAVGVSVGVIDSYPDMSSLGPLRILGGRRGVDAYIDQLLGPNKVNEQAPRQMVHLVGDGPCDETFSPVANLIAGEIEPRHSQLGWTRHPGNEMWDGQAAFPADLGAAPIDDLRIDQDQAARFDLFLREPELERAEGHVINDGRAEKLDVRTLGDEPISR